MLARVKEREGEYSTLTILCTNALGKVRPVNHRVLLTLSG